MRTKEEIQNEFEAVKLEIENLKQEFRETLKAKRNKFRDLIKEASETITTLSTQMDLNNFKAHIEKIILEEIPNLDISEILKEEDYITFRNLLWYRLDYQSDEAKSKVRNRIAKVKREIENA